MKHKWICALWAFAFSFGLSVAATMCITSAFGFYIDTALLIHCCGIAALLVSLCFTLPLGFIPLGTGIVALGYLWQKNLLLSSLDAILNRISRRYNAAYGWDILRLSVRTAEEMEPDIVFILCILGCAVALLISWAVCRKKSIIPGLLTSLLLLIPCFVVNDSVPAVPWLYLYFLCFITLLLTASVREHNTQQGNRLCLMVVPITAAALLILFAAIPQSTYNRQKQAEQLTEKILGSELYQQFLGHKAAGGDPTVDGKTVDLKTVGYRVETHIQTLEVTAPFTGTLYLRGRAMDLYDGVSWTDSEKYYTSLTWPGYHLDNVGEVHISTRFAHPMLYIPYYASITDMRNVTLGITNEKKLTDYSFTCRQLPEGNYLSQLTFNNFNLHSLSQYIEMDSDVHRWAQPLAKKLTADAQNPYQIAQAIASYVRNSATYNTRTPRMPASKHDFALWFLDHSDTGYCVHFATATTVLLQAAGIPSRYVTGYMTPVEEGKPITVYADQAHAWTEYWLPGFGWAVLESTPAENTQPRQEATETTTTPAPTETQSPDVEPTQTQPSVSQTGNTTAPTQPETQTTIWEKFSRDALWPLLRFVLWVAAIATLPLLVVYQRRLRLSLRQKKRAAATANERALLYWQDATLYSKLLKEIPDTALFELAQRAKFSQHTLTKDELDQFTEQLAVSQEKLQQKNLLLRLYYRYILALY